MTRGRILIADDDTSFRTSATALLAREGYEVDTSDNADDALTAVTTQAYDLLITDLEMPGNTDLDLVQQVAHVGGGLPVIIVTGYPSVKSSLACIELPVAAYLVKPIDFPALLTRVSAAIARYRSYQSMQRAESRLRAYRDEYYDLAKSTPRDTRSGVDSFLSLTLRNVLGSINDLEQLGRALVSANDTPSHVCQLINCPRGKQLQQAVEDTIAQLEESKEAFRSKPLADLRRRLELLVDHG